MSNNLEVLDDIRKTLERSVLETKVINMFAYYNDKNYDIRFNAKNYIDREIDMIIDICGETLAIETNGTGPHSYDELKIMLKKHDVSDEEIKAFHQYKCEAVNFKNGKYYQIDEYYFEHKNPIICSMFARRLNSNKVMYIDSEKCGEPLEISKGMARQFSNDYDLSNINFNIDMKYYGLFDHDEGLVCIIGVGKNSTKRSGYQIYNLCEKNFIHVINGFKKLVDHIMKLYKDDILTIVIDRRFFNGTFWKEMGFERTSKRVEPRFQYINNKEGYCYSEIQYEEKKSRLTPEQLSLLNLTKVADAGVSCFKYFPKRKFTTDDIITF